jgi:hypothetical protein
MGRMTGRFRRAAALESLQSMLRDPLHEEIEAPLSALGAQAVSPTRMPYFDWGSSLLLAGSRELHGRAALAGPPRILLPPGNKVYPFRVLPRLTRGDTGEEQRKRVSAGPWGGPARASWIDTTPSLSPILRIPEFSKS